MIFSFPQQILIILLIVSLTLTLLWVLRLELRLRKLLRGTDKKSLESGLVGLKRTEEEFHTFREQTEADIARIKEKLKQSITHIRTIRFDPFKGSSSGGNQSFATAFLNENKDGVVISTIHTRDRVNIFSKPIQKGSSTFELTEEEQNVIEGTQGSKE